MPGIIRIHNSVAANITVKVSSSTSTAAHTEGKCASGKEVIIDLSKMKGWENKDTIQLSVHADGGVTRHNNAGEYQPAKDYRYTVKGTLDAFSVQGPV